jgi:hypothetical protein
VPAVYLDHDVTEPQRLARLGLVRQPQQIQARAHRAAASRRVAETSRAARADLEMRHPEFVRLNLRGVAAFWMMVGGLVAVAIFDLVMSAPTAEYFTRQYVQASPGAVTAAKWLLPFAILAIELYIAARCHLADREEGLGQRTGWMAIAVLMVAVMPGLVAATQLASAEDRDSVFWVRFVALVTFAVVIHAVVLFGGRLGHDAKAYVVYALRHRNATVKIDHHMDSAVRQELAAGRLFENYRMAVDEYVLNNPQAPSVVCMFDMETRDVLNRHFGRPVIRDEERPAAATPTTGVDPTRRHAVSVAAAARQPEAPPVEATMEEIMRRVRDQEAEVRP